MDKKKKAGEMMRTYGASEAQVNKWLAQQAASAVTEQHGKDAPPGAYKVNVDYSALELRVMNMPDWHPLPMDIRVVNGIVDDALRFTARNAKGEYERCRVRLSQLDHGAEAEITRQDGHLTTQRLRDLPDCGWLLPQLLAAREQYQADLWAIIKGDKQ